jgi:hypothetical protein
VAREKDLEPDHSTGTHIHLGWIGRDVEELKRAIELARVFEPALGTLVAPSRLAHFGAEKYDLRQPNQYCEPVSKVFTRRALDGARTPTELLGIAHESEQGRYLTFNILPFDSYHTVEVRMHSGTLEASKILPWLSLWMQILWAAAQKPSLPPVPDTDVIVPNVDIVELARLYLPAVQSPSLLARLVSRRREVVARWRQVPELSPWAQVADVRGW